MNASPLRGVILILAAAVLWGTTGTAQSFASPALSSYWVGTFRLVVAALFFAAWAAWVALASRRTGRGDGATGSSSPSSPAGPAVPSRLEGSGSSTASLAWFVVGAALSMTLYNLAFFAGVRASTVALGTAVALGSAPVWAGLLQTLASRRPPPLSWWLGVGIAAGGLALALQGADGGTVRPLGIGLCLAAGLGYALYARCTKHLVEHPSLVLVTGAVFALAAAFAVPVAGALAGVPKLAGGDVVVLLWLGVAGTGLAYFLFALGLRHVASATAVALGMAEPVAAVGFAVAIVGERPGGVALAGLVAVMIGLAVLVRTEVDSRG